MVLSAGAIALLLNQQQSSAGISDQLIGKILERASGLVGPPAQVFISNAGGAAGSADEAIDSATGETESENLVYSPEEVAPLKRNRRRSRKAVTALLWMTLALWIVIPLYELAGSDFVWGPGRPGLFNRTAMNALRSGLRVTLEAVGRDRPPVRETSEESLDPLSDSSAFAQDDERCKRCLGTNCGAEDRPGDSIRRRNSLWNWLFSRN
jgi:hypothetical protein